MKNCNDENRKFETIFLETEEVPMVEVVIGESEETNCSEIINLTKEISQLRNEVTFLKRENDELRSKLFQNR